MNSREQRIEWVRNKKDICPMMDTSMFIRPKMLYEFQFKHDISKTPLKVSSIPELACCCTIDQELIDIDVAKLTDSNPLKALSDQFNETALPKPCHFCEEQEQSGAISERLRSAGYFFNTDESWDSYLEDRKNVSHYEINIKFSNFCNLACRVCSPTESTTYGKITNTGGTSEGDISENTVEWNLLLEFIEKKILEYSLVKLITVGGETFLNDGFYKLIDWLCEKDYAKKVEIRITTNLTVNPTADLLKKFEQFREIGICASLDSTYENFHYVRWPGKWSKIEENINTFSEYNSLHKNLNFFLVINWNLNNIFYIDDFIEYWYDKPIFSSVYTMHLYRPLALQVEQLPVRYRAPIIEKLIKCKDHDFFVKFKNKSVESFYDFITSTINYYTTNTTDDILQFNHYLRFNAGFDFRTNTSITKHNSRLYDLFTDADKEAYQKYYEFYSTKGVSIPLSSYGFPLSSHGFPLSLK